ncbi:hypothetical protein CVD19_03250 [Bacillus sp. T33-2]|nr:hypothetical protein CVD19_03250 [Bacillus sp. T33-2]
MIILKHYYLSELEREKFENELFIVNPHIGKDDILSLDDKELVALYEEQTRNRQISRIGANSPIM